MQVIIAITDGEDSWGYAYQTAAHFNALTNTSTIYRLIGLGFADEKQTTGANALNALAATAATNGVNIRCDLIPLTGDALEGVLQEILVESSKATVDTATVKVNIPTNFNYVVDSLIVKDVDGNVVNDALVSATENAKVDGQNLQFSVKSPKASTYKYSYKLKINQAEAAKLKQAEFKNTAFNHVITFDYTYGDAEGSIVLEDTVSAKTHKVTVNSCENSTIKNVYGSAAYYVGNGASHSATWAPKTKDDKLQGLVVTTYPVGAKEVANAVDTKTLTEDAYALTNITECTNIYVSYVKELPSIDVKPTPKDDKVVGLPSVATGQNTTALVATLVAVAGASLYLAYRLNRYRKSL
ncbi:hypothetical protein A4S06_00560 [Erysipelotrichaceae bacterium MTC7]|nr:hypothetical protein A4S06_00560 [Erysipelotrichaceae bacterium MTC7]